MRKQITLLSLSFLVSSSPFALPAPFQADQVITSKTYKDNHYIRGGMFIGGDRLINEVIVQDLRFARNKDFERLVIDLLGLSNGEKAALPRPPYYQVSLDKDLGQIYISIWGDPALNFKKEEVQKALLKSQMIESVDLLPKVEKGIWTFALKIKNGLKLEVFELQNPVRVILDIQSASN